MTEDGGDLPFVRALKYRIDRVELANFWTMQPAPWPPEPLALPPWRLMVENQLGPTWMALPERPDLKDLVESQEPLPLERWLTYEPMLVEAREEIPFYHRPGAQM